MEKRRDRGADTRAVDSVLRAIAFAEERMGDDIGVEDLARAAYFSPFYFSRLFAEATGHAPYDYLMRRRIAVAAEDVVGTDRSLTEIALDRGFAVQDSFGRAFRRCFGILPSEARRRGTYPREIARTRIERAYVEEMLAEAPPRPEAARAAELILAGTRESRFAVEGLRPGGIAVVERADDLAARGAFIGTVADVSAPPYPAAATRLPAGPRARFRVEGGARRLAFVVEYAYRTWLPASPYLRGATFDLVERADDVVFLDLPLAAAEAGAVAGSGAVAGARAADAGAAETADQSRDR